MKRFRFLLLTIALILALVPTGMVQAQKSAPSLTGTINYWLVAHLGQFDAEGRLLVWEGTITGDIEGVMKWWFVLGGGPPNMPGTAHVSFYEARWEIFDSAGDLVLAGESAGVTARPPGKDGIWTGNGKVTEAYGDFEDWNGRQSYESGSVIWAPFPFYGTGIFRIN